MCLTCIIRQRQLFFRSKIPLLLDIELTFVSRWGFINSSRIPTRKIDGSGILEDLQSDFQSKKQTALPFYICICCLKLWNRASNQRVQFAQECYKVMLNPFEKCLMFYIDMYMLNYRNPLLITNCSWILTIYKDRIFGKKLLENKELNFKNGVKIYRPRVILAHVR